MPHPGADYQTAYALRDAWLQETAWTPADGCAPGLQMAWADCGPHVRRGDCVPIGDTPDGGSWVGAQSLQPGEGYFLILRENTPEPAAEVRVHGLANRVLLVRHLAGRGIDCGGTVTPDHRFAFDLPEPWTFGFYYYRIVE